jgi:hypothetical protein
MTMSVMTRREGGDTNMRSRRGQSTAEYAVLFAIVLGAAIAMQQYIRLRLQASTQAGTQAYATEAATLFPAAGLTIDSTFSPDRVVAGSSGTDVEMSSSTRGTVDSVSGSTSVINN